MEKSRLLLCAQVCKLHKFTSLLQQWSLCDTKFPQSDEYISCPLRILFYVKEDEFFIKRKRLILKFRNRAIVFYHMGTSFTLWQKHHVNFSTTVGIMPCWLSQFLSHLWCWGSQTLFVTVLKFHNYAVHCSLPFFGRFICYCLQVSCFCFYISDHLSPANLSKDKKTTDSYISFSEVSL